MKHSAGWIFAIGLCLAGPPAIAGADAFDPARAAIRKHMLEHTVPGLAVAVWKDGRIIWEEGFGWADMENRVPATAHTVFSLASVSKPLTATGLMKLVQEGKVDLGRPVNDYLGANPVTIRAGESRDVTVERVANHTAGLAPGSQCFYGDEVPAALSTGEAIRRYALTVNPPGERHWYSNIGYGVLGQLIAQVSNRSYADFMRREVFLPLGMTHSSVYLAPGLERHQAIRYDFDRKPIPLEVCADTAAGMTYASAHDMARFGLFFLKNPLADQKSILSEDSISRMTTNPVDAASRPVVPAPRDAYGYALGWEILSDGGYRLVGHSGSMSGVHAMFMLVPEERVGVVTLANVDGGGGALYRDLLKSVLPKWKEPASAPGTQPEAPAFRPPAQLLGSWGGEIHTYEGKQPISLKVLASGDVHVSVGGEPRFRNRSTLRQPALLNGASFKDGELSGHTLAQIETTDARRRPHTLTLNLRLHEGVLSGTVMASSVYEGWWIYSLPHWAELRHSD